MNEAAFFQDLAVLMVVVGLVSAVFTRFRLPKVVGYVVVGVLMSQHVWLYFGKCPILNDPGSLSAIGQLGIVFLMFSLGLEFSASEMKKVKHVTVPTALFDAAMMIWLGYTVARKFLGWGVVPSLFIGAAICDSATTLLAKTIDEMKWSKRPFVRYIYGTTICEDILCVGVIALISGVAAGKGLSAGAVGISLGGFFLFLVGVIVFGLIVVPRLLNAIARQKDDESLLLTLLGCCFLVSFVAAKLDFSLALGAFLVGILGAGSEVRDRLNHLVAPLRNMFAAIFFVTIGLLVDPTACWKHLPAILGLAMVVMVGKGFNCFTMSILCGQRVKDAVQTGFGLAQIGEFAYMVALMYISQTKDSASPIYQIVVGASLITTCLNPLMLRVSDPVGDWLERRLPAFVRGWLSAYADWLARFRAAVVPSFLQRRIRSRLIWLGVVLILNMAVAFGMSMLDALDYSLFSKFFDMHKREFFCLVANLFCASMLAPMLGLGRSLGHDIGAVLVGTRDPRHWRDSVVEFGRSLSRDVGAVLVGTRVPGRWRASVVRLVTWFVMAGVSALATAQIIMINVNLLPDGTQLRWLVLAVIAVITVFGWKRFARAGRRAGLRFNEALAAEKRRENSSSVISLSVPNDFYNNVVVKSRAVVGRTIKELDIRATTGASIVSVTRDGVKNRNPGPDWRFRADDEVVAIGSPAQLARVRGMLAD